MNQTAAEEVECSNEHRRTIDNPNTKSKPTTTAEHFLSSTNHTANDMQFNTHRKSLF